MAACICQDVSLMLVKKDLKTNCHSLSSLNVDRSNGLGVQHLPKRRQAEVLPFPPYAQHLAHKSNRSLKECTITPHTQMIATVLRDNNTVGLGSRSHRC